jgi:hypothetical protein
MKMFMQHRTVMFWAKGKRWALTIAMMPCVQKSNTPNWTDVVRGPKHLTHLVDGLARAPKKGVASNDIARVNVCNC